MSSVQNHASLCLSPKISLASKVGWDDAKKKLPFRNLIPEPINQRNYEAGRLRRFEYEANPHNLPDNYTKVFVAMSNSVFGNESLTQFTIMPEDPECVAKARFSRGGVPLPVPTVCNR